MSTNNHVRLQTSDRVLCSGKRKRTCRHWFHVKLEKKDFGNYRLQLNCTRHNVLVK